jgi:hypothetical protein
MSYRSNLINTYIHHFLGKIFEILIILLSTTHGHTFIEDKQRSTIIIYYIYYIIRAIISDLRLMFNTSHNIRS